MTSSSNMQPSMLFMLAHSLPQFWPVTPEALPAGSPGAGPDRGTGELTLPWGKKTEASTEDMSWDLHTLV